MMEKLKSESSSTSVPISELLKQYVKHSATGALFQTRQDPKNDKKVFLRAKNSYKCFTKQQISQGIVDGTWKEPNEHELRKHIAEENAYFEEYSHRLIKRVLYTQLLLEVDSDLMQDHADDKDTRKLLERSEKRFERLTNEHFKNLYNTDKEYLTNFMNSMDRVINKVSRLGVHEFLVVEKMMDEYLANPEKFTPETIEMVRIDGDLVKS